MMSLRLLFGIYAFMGVTWYTELKCHTSGMGFTHFQSILRHWYNYLFLAYVISNLDQFNALFGWKWYQMGFLHISFDLIVTLYIIYLSCI